MADEDQPPSYDVTVGHQVQQRGVVQPPDNLMQYNQRHGLLTKLVTGGMASPISERLTKRSFSNAGSSPPPKPRYAKRYKVVYPGNTYEDVDMHKPILSITATTLPDVLVFKLGCASQGKFADEPIIILASAQKLNHGNMKEVQGLAVLYYWDILRAVERDMKKILDRVNHAYDITHSEAKSAEKISVSAASMQLIRQDFLISRLKGFRIFLGLSPEDYAVCELEKLAGVIKRRLVALCAVLQRAAELA